MPLSFANKNKRRASMNPNSPNKSPEREKSESKSESNPEKPDSNIRPLRSQSEGQDSSAAGKSTSGLSWISQLNDGSTSFEDQLRKFIAQRPLTVRACAVSVGVVASRLIANRSEKSKRQTNKLPTN